MSAINWSIFAAVAAVITPLTLLLMREVIRRRRSGLLEDLLETLFKDNPNIPTLEFVRNKYGAKQTHRSATDVAPQGQPVATDSLTRSYILLISAIPYLAFSILGFQLLIEPICELIETGSCSGSWISHALFWIEQAGDPNMFNPQLLAAAAIAGSAFLGAYIFTLRALLRAVMNFELSPITWLRSAIHIFTGVVIALLLYRSLNSTPYLKNFLQITLDDRPDAPLRLWLAVAFVAGYIPDFGLATILRQLRITYLKTVNDDIMKHVAIIPVEIVDGIDYDIRYRLEETNIVDVQNLATYNPILLFVETPYGLYEAFDWVLQAQLCLVVGPQTFLELKKHKVRTIFDLERAVLGDEAPDAFIRMIGSILYSDANPEVRKLISTNSTDAELDVASIRHAVEVMGDDLHIHRLRQLWSEIYKQLTPIPGREWLYRKPKPQP